MRLSHSDLPVRTSDNATSHPGPSIMTLRTHITGLVLAGGAGQRMGGQDKGLLDWRGRPLITHALEKFTPQVGSVLISCNRNIEQYAALGFPLVTDLRPDFQGPLAGLEAAIPMIQTEFLAICPCDTPGLPVDMIERLLQALEAERNREAQISYVYDGERDQFLCALLRTRCLTSLTGYLDSGHRTVRHWYRELNSVAVDFSGSGQCFQNINRLNS